MDTDIKFNNFNFFFLMFIILLILLVPAFFYAPYLMFKKGFSFNHLSIWLASIFFPIIILKFLQTIFNVIEIKENQIVISRPLLFFNYGVQKENKINFDQIKTVQKEHSNGLLLTSYLLKDDNNEVIEFFSCKKSKKLQRKIDSLLPFEILEGTK